ncbi:MAG: GNAT family N-acetyltransferase [Actinomycetota bacterium]
MSLLPERIETDRLTLRTWDPSDAELLGTAITRSIEHLRPYMVWIADEPMTVEARAELLRNWRRESAEMGDGTYAMLADGEVVGSCGLHHRLGPGALEIGYWVHVDHVRRGYATEAARALTTAGLAADGIERIEIHHDASNQSSAGVPRALGYRRGPDRSVEPTAPSETGTFWTWFVTADDWPPQR